MSALRDRVYVVDDDPIVRRSVARVLRFAGFEALTFGSADELLAAVDPEAEGCALLDVAMPGIDGLALQEALVGRGIALPILFLTGHGDVPASVRAMKAGAVDFLTKPVEDEILLAAVRQAVERGRVERDARRDAASARARFDALTAREREVLECVIGGMLNKQVARELGITEATVKVHRGRVMEKTGISSLAELVRVADLAGLRPPPRPEG